MSKKIPQKFTKGSILPIQMQQIQLPVFVEKIFNGQKYVRYGDDNLFPQFLQMLANRSALHNAIITTKLDYAYGKGLDYRPTDKDVLTSAFLNHPNPYESFHDIYKKALYDYILYGAFALNIIWDADGEHLAEVYHCDVTKLRSGLKGRFGVVDEYYYADTWYKNATRNYESIKSFNPKNRKGGQILYYKQYRPGVDYYALPSYCGCLNSIATDVEISNFHLSHILNGMSPSKMITFMDGVPSEEEELDLKSKIEELYTGTDNAGKFILNFVDTPERAPKIDTLGGDNLGDEFIQLEDSVQNQILVGHKVSSPLLVGLRSVNNGLGSNADEIYNAYQVFVNNVIKPIQDEVLKVFNDILPYTKGYEGLTLAGTLNTPIEFTYSEQTLTQICTKNELRERIGLEPLDENKPE